MLQVTSVNSENHADRRLQEVTGAPGTPADLPKYQQIAALLRREILKGGLAPGERLPSVRELAERHGANKATLGQTMKQLAREGLIELKEKKGAFVRPQAPRTAAVVFDRNIYDLSRTPYPTLLLAELERAFQAQGWQCRPFLNTSPWAWDTFHEALRARAFEVVVCATSKFTETTFDLIQQIDMPVVGAYCADGLASYVMFDSGELGRRGVDALVAAGARRIGLVYGRVQFSRDRGPLPGYEAGLAAHGLAFDPALVRCVPFEERHGREAFVSLMAQAPDLDGLVVADELLMQGVVRELLQHAIRVPEDLRVASQVSDPQEDPFWVPVIRLYNHVPQQAQHLAELATALAEGRPVAHTRIRIPPQIKAIEARRLSPVQPKELRV